MHKYSWWAAQRKKRFQKQFSDVALWVVHPCEIRIVKSELCQNSVKIRTYLTHTNQNLSVKIRSVKIRYTYNNMNLYITYDKNKF